MLLVVSDTTSNTSSCYDLRMGDLLTALAAAQPDKTAIIDDRTGVTGTDDVRTCTYAEFEDRANQLAHVLDGLGVGPGDKVVWCGQNSTGILELTSASRKIGSTAVPLNYRLSDEEAAYVIDHCDATTVVHRRRVRRPRPAGAVRDPEGHQRVGVRR